MTRSGPQIYLMLQTKWAQWERRLCIGLI